MTDKMQIEQIQQIEQIEQKDQSPVQWGIVYSINISSKKGGRKFPVEKAVIDELGLVGDGHRGNWNRQVSLLSNEKIENFNNVFAEIAVTAGDFGENITTLNFNLESLKVGDRLKIFDDCNSINDENLANLSDSSIRSDSHSDNCIILEVSQIGKNCPKPCSIYYRVGSCIMPNFGIFCKVVKGGIIKKGFKISLI